MTDTKRKPKRKPITKTYPCKGGCGYPVPYPDTYCGECLCEDDRSND